MSHFVGVVVMTPQYWKKHNLESALEKYSENLKVPEYSDGLVSAVDKIDFITHYNKETVRKNIKEKLFDKLLSEDKITKLPDSNYSMDWNYHEVAKQHEDEFLALFNENYPGLFDTFDELYEKEGGDWNNFQWRFNYLKEQWESYSEDNPNSKWDWYTEGGRWNNCLKTKDGEFVNKCLLKNLDLSIPAPADNEDYHIGEHSAPFCLVVDGEWFEKGEMGWFGISTNDKPQEDWNTEFVNILKKLPDNSRVYLIDFHI